jgi:hypothetical protein
MKEVRTQIYDNVFWLSTDQIYQKIFSQVSSQISGQCSGRMFREGGQMFNKIIIDQVREDLR